MFISADPPARVFNVAQLIASQTLGVRSTHLSLHPLHRVSSRACGDAGRTQAHMRTPMQIKLNVMFLVLFARQ